MEEAGGLFLIVRVDRRTSFGDCGLNGESYGADVGGLFEVDAQLHGGAIGHDAGVENGLFTGLGTAAQGRDKAVVPGRDSRQSSPAIEGW